tara:strand:- start:60481 stop:61962 length:1482 start_codon:yes stop_codon:yes gene_type:complete
MEENNTIETNAEVTPPEFHLHPDDVELEVKYPTKEDLAYPSEESFELELSFLDNEKQEDKLWQARTGLDFDSLCGAIETVVFMSDKPVSLQRIKNLIDEDMPLRVIHASIERLQEEYESKHHGLRLVEVAEGYQYRTKATYSKYVQDLFKVNSLVLSPTALEVLAIISYKQPISKTEVDKIRGVDSGHIVRGLMDKRLVKVCGRSEEMGRPVLYGTTPEFLEVFNLARIEDLPPERELEEIIDEGVGKISDIKSIVQNGDKEAFVFDEIDELDDLTEAIKLISSDTDFTKSLKGNSKKAQGNSENEETGTTRRSAFDLLEEYVNKDIITRANTEAFESEMMSGVADPQIVSDLTAGPYNTPELVDEEEDDFQMIDLETGLPIEDDIEDGMSEQTASEQESEQEAISLLGDTEEEAQMLSDALDDAFARLTGDKLDEQEVSEELGLDQKRIDQEEQDLDNLTGKIVEGAKDLDLDLGFLQSEDENQENNSNSES